MARPLRPLRFLRRPRGLYLLAAMLTVAALGSALDAPIIGSAGAAPTLGGAIPGPLPVFPPDNWWNLDISTAPVDPASATYISFIGSAKTLHPDFGGDVTPGSTQVYGFPYAVVDSTTTLQAVQFQYADQSDGVDHVKNQSIPFYPIPDAAITQAHWIEGGDPGNVDLRNSSDRHLLIIDRDRRYLYELYNVFYDGSQWHAGSGAFFNLNANDRRDGTSDKRIRLSGVASRRFHERCASHGRTTAVEGDAQPLDVSTGNAEGLSGDATIRAHRCRQWIGSIYQRYLRHPLEQRRAEPRFSCAHSK
jgi:hypothetical protein